MNSVLSKIKAYIGFAKKSRQITFGVDDIIKLKNAKVIIVSDSLGESSMKKVKNYSETKKIEMLCLKSEDFKNLENESIKAIAITDKGLADAIKINLTTSLGGKVE